MEEIQERIEVVKLFREVVTLLKHTFTKGFEAYGITAPQGMVIGILCKSKNTKIKISEVSAKLGLSNSTVSGIIDRLENQGIVERTRSEEDRRVVYVTLSEHFEEMHKDFHKIAEKNIESLMKKGTPEDIGKITDGLNALKKLLGDEKK